MNKLPSKARDLGIFSENPDKFQALEAYNKCQDVMPIASVSANQRKRRRAQLSWRTVVNELRNREKQ